MSVINQVLKDLDRQGANSTVPSGVIAINQMAAASQRPYWLAGAAAVLLVAAGWFWATMTPATAPSPASEASQPAEAAPQLRLSQQLDLPPAGEPASTPEQAQQMPSTQIAEASQSRSASAPPSAIVFVPQPPRLDTRLSEPRASLPAPAAHASVAKVWTAEPEAKSATPQAQAEEAWRQAGRLLEQGRNHDAQARLEAALRLDPGHSDARQSLIALVLEAGDAARAESLLREGQTQHPNDVWYPRSLAQLQMQRGEYAPAAAILKTALQNAAGRQRDGRRNGDAPDWALYAGTLAKLGQVEESAAAYREALRRDAGQGAWWVGLGVVLEQAGQPGQASEAYARAVQTRVSVELREYAAQRLRVLK